MSEKPEEQRRIAELEAELVRLRGRLGEQDSREPAAPEGGPERPFHSISRGKVVGLAVAVALLALAAFAVIFFALSSGVDSLSKKAAKTFVPDPPAVEGTGSSAPAPPGPAAPGL